MPMQDLLEIMAKLRDPRRRLPVGPRADVRTVAPYTLEEAYEVTDAIERGDLVGLREELGDLLLQVVFHAQMAREQGALRLRGRGRAASATSWCAGIRTCSAAQVGGQRDADAAGKRPEGCARRPPAAAGRACSTTCRSTLPALDARVKLTKRAARVGFDWPDADGVRAKVDEETRRTRRRGARPATPSAVAAEFGDVLFALANLGRAPRRRSGSRAARHEPAKFESRFRHVERAARGTRPAGRRVLEEFWSEAKPPNARLTRRQDRSGSVQSAGLA
jgi:nucleoside triphosphate diphosphatase